MLEDLSDCCWLSLGLEAGVVASVDVAASLAWGVVVVSGPLADGGMSGSPSGLVSVVLGKDWSDGDA